MTTGTVSSNNLTSLYSNTTSFTAGVVNSSVYSVNGGLGVTVNPTTGNVVVAIGQDVATTANVTFANITATGSLSNNYYTLANAVGTNGQVLTTNGLGVTTWTTPSTLGLVNSVSGSGAGISVSPTTGAVIVSNTGVTSIVAGSNISISGATGAVTITATGFGNGDVVGPASATDNAIVRFDQTTGKLIQNSVVTIADTTGNIVTPGDIAVNGGDITTTATTASVFNNNALTVNAFTAATTLNIGAPFPGITTIGGDAVVNGDLTVLADILTINSDKTDADVYIYFGRVAPNGDAVIRWNNSPTNSFEWSKDSSTYYDFIPANLTPTFYNGQLLSYQNGEWINDNKVTVSDANERNVFSYRPLTPPAGFNTSLFLRKDYSNAAIGTPGVGTYANGAGTALTFQVVSDTQSPPSGSAGQANTYATIAGIYSATVPELQLKTSINNGSTNTNVATFSTTAATIGGTTLTLDANNTGAANNSSIIANRGSSGTDATLTWTESTGFWTFNEDVFSTGEVIGNTAVGTNGQYVTFNNENTSPSGTCYLLVKSGVSAGVDASISWNDSTKRWQNTFDGTTVYNLPNQNLDTTDDVNFASVIVDGITTYNSQTTTTTAFTPTSISATSRLSQKSIITIIDNVTGEMHMLEALTFRKGTTAYLTTYAEMYSSAALATFTATGTGGFTSIIATPLSTNSTTFNVARISLD